MNSIHTGHDSFDFNLLRVFEVVFRERHLTRAADALALTPSAVSHALRRLRAQLGDELFVRQGNAMVPTPACHRLAPMLFEQMADLRRLLQQWASFDPANTRHTFRVAMPEAVEMTLFPALQRAFFECAPEGALFSVNFERANLSRLMSAGQFDIAIDVAQLVVDPIKHRPLMHDDFCIVASSRHPLKRAPTLNEYLKARHIAVSGRSSGIVLEDHALLKLGVQRHITARCQNYTSAFSVVGSSDYLLTMPVELSKEVAKPYGLRRWRPPFKLPPVELHLYWHVNNDQDTSSLWLRELIVQVIQTRWTKQSNMGL
jgi:DNA-binding transcriptional LysR family regulator